MIACASLNCKFGDEERKFDRGNKASEFFFFFFFFFLHFFFLRDGVCLDPSGSWERHSRESQREERCLPPSSLTFPHEVSPRDRSWYPSNSHYTQSHSPTCLAASRYAIIHLPAISAFRRPPLSSEPARLFLSLAGAATSVIFIATNTCLSRQTHLLSRQKYACHDKTFVTTNIFLSRQINICRDKHNIVATSLLLSRQNTCFVATKNMFCRDNNYACGNSRQ